MIRRKPRPGGPRLKRSCLIVAAIALACRAQPTQAPPAPSASTATEAEVIARLNSSVDWYHAVKASDAWLVQANDDFYKSSQDALASQVLTNAFAYAQAMIAVVGRDETSGSKRTDGDSRAARLATR